ncbi:MAG: energy transducer TonB [Hyphomicrobiaceae bacterium]
MGLSAAAFADIKAFNAAVSKGDYKTAASEAEEIWKTWDKTNRQTALVVREFGFAAYMSGRFDLAKEFGQFLVEQGGGLPTPDKDPRISAVLYRAADFALTSGDAQAQSLRQALRDRSKEADIDMTSVLAWERLYLNRFAKGAWGEAEADAAAAAEFFGRASALLVKQRNAELTKNVSVFMGERLNNTPGRNRTYFGMADLHDALVADINRIEDENVLKQLWPVKWISEAWVYSLESWLEESNRVTGTRISSELKPRVLKEPDYAQYPEDPATRSLPICDGKFEGKEVRYPSSKAFTGHVGTVIARVETDTLGKVTHVEMLAQVPTEGFGESVVSTLETWKYVPSTKSAGTSCRLNFRNYTYKVRFYIS